MEGRTPERIYGTVEKVAKFWNDSEDSLSEILAKPLGYVKSALISARDNLREDLADLFLYIPYGTLMRIEHYIGSRLEQAKTAIKKDRNIRNVSSTVADFVSFPLYAIAALPFWEKMDRRREREEGERALKKLGYEIRGDDVFQIITIPLNGSRIKIGEQLVARLKRDMYNGAEVHYTKTPQIEPVLRAVGYVDIASVNLSQ